MGANVVVVIGLWWRQGGISEIHDAAGLLTSLGRVTGMVGALLALVQLLLLARIPVLDEIALDRVNGWHRWNGIACVVLLVAHTVLITAGYALADGVGLGREIADLFGNYSGVLIATIGLALLVAVAITSGAAARRRLGRRAWHAIHVTAYLGVALGFSHQLATGHEFQRQPVARAYWWALYAAAVLAIVALRLVVPVVRSLATIACTSSGSSRRGRRRHARDRRHGLDGLGHAPGSTSTVASSRPVTVPAGPLSLSAAPDGPRCAAHRARAAGARPSLATPAARDPRDRRGPRRRADSDGAAAGADRADRGRPGIAPVRALLEDLPGAAAMSR